MATKIYLKRQLSSKEEEERWRLDHLLLRKAKEGVKVIIRFNAIVTNALIHVCSCTIIVCTCYDTAKTINLKKYFKKIAYGVY